MTARVVLFLTATCLVPAWPDDARQAPPQPAKQSQASSPSPGTPPQAASPAGGSIQSSDPYVSARQRMQARIYQQIEDERDPCGADRACYKPFTKAATPNNVTEFLQNFQGIITSGTSDVQQNRTDLQAGSSPTTSGSTSIATKGAVSNILSIAVDNGGLTREVSGTTVTFRGTPLGLVDAFRQYDYFDILSSIQTDSMVKFWNALSFAVAFDTSRGSVPGTLVANSKQLSSWSVRATIFNQRDAKRREYALLWHALSNKYGKKVGDSEAAALKQFEAWPAFTQWRDQADAAFRVYDRRYQDHPEELNQIMKDFLADFENRLDQIVNAVRNQNPPGTLTKAVKDVFSSWAELGKDANTIMTYVNRGQLLTTDWTTKRDPALPDLYTNTLIYQASPWKNRTTDLTVNGAVDWYRAVPAATMMGMRSGRFKDANVVADYTIPLGSFQPIGKFQLSFTGKYQYIGASVVNATSMTGATTSMPASTSASTMPPALENLLPTIKGNLGAFQVKLTIPGGKSGIRIPLAFTAATRSEVFSRPDYRANVGVSFDFDSLFQKTSN